MMLRTGIVLIMLGLLGCGMALRAVDDAAVGPALRSIEILSDDSECMSVEFHQLTCDEFDRRVAELESDISRLRQLVGFVEPIGLEVVPGQLFGLHVFPFRDERTGERLVLISEEFLLRPERRLLVQRATCVMVDRPLVRRRTLGTQVARCQYLMAVVAGEYQRARWLWRTLPDNDRPGLVREAEPPPYRRCPLPCSVAIDRLA